MSDLTLIAQKLIDVGWNFSMDTSNLSLLVVKLIVLSLKFINKQCLWDKLFNKQENNNVDWSLIKEEYNAFSDFLFWIPLLELCSWKNVPSEMKSHTVMINMKNALFKAGIDIADDYNTACQLLILHLLHGVPVLYAFETLTCRKLNKNTHNIATTLISNISNVFYKPEDFEEILQYILHDNYIEVNTQQLQERISIINTRQETLKVLSKQHTDSVISSGRPRLRDLLEFSTREKIKLDTTLGTWESYTSYCQLHQFPNILNDVVKQKIYFFAAQTSWPWQDHIETLLGHHGELTSKIVQYPVTKPDLDILHFCIQRMNMNGRAPFKELISFKNKCFINFPLSTFSLMNLTQFLRLYVCIYQNITIWKELWKLQHILFSPQVIKDCEIFVAETPFNALEFLNFFC
jgi:hypothetical protein